MAGEIKFAHVSVQFPSVLHECNGQVGICAVDCPELMLSGAVLSFDMERMLFTLRADCGCSTSFPFNIMVAQLVSLMLKEHGPIQTGGRDGATTH